MLHLLLLKHLLLFHLHLPPHHLLLLEPLLFNSGSLLLFRLLLLPLFLGLLLLLLCSLDLCSLLHLRLLLRLSLGLRLRRCLGCSLCCIVVLGLRAVSWWLAVADLAEDFRDEWLGVNARRGSSEHLLEPDVRFVSLLAGEDHARLHVELLLDDHFSKRDQLDEERQFALLIFEAL